MRPARISYQTCPLHRKVDGCLLDFSKRYFSLKMSLPRHITWPAFFLNFKKVFFYIWYYNIITSIPTSLFSFQTPQHTPVCSLWNTWPLFSLIIVTSIHVYSYTYISLTTCSVYVIAICTFVFKAEHWYRITKCYALPWGRSFLPLSAFFGFLQYLEFEASWVFLHSLVYCYCLCSSRACHVVRLNEFSFCH